MCYPKPGPRCAAHTRGAMVTAKLGLRGAEKVLDEIGEPDSSWDKDETDAYNQSLKRVDAARAKYDAALREYETTPQGQQALKDAIAQMRDEGLNEESLIAQKRLMVAEKVRDRQKSDYEESLRYEENLNEVIATNPEAAADLTLNAARLRSLRTALDAAQQEVRHQQILKTRGLSTEVDIADASQKVDMAEAEWQAQGRINAAQRAAYAHGYTGSGLAVDLTKPGALRGNVFTHTDGTYNLVRHSRMTAGFPDGRIVPVVGIEDTYLYDGTHVHALKFADGTTDFAKVETLANGEVQTYSIPGMRLVPPLHNAQPAREVISWDLVARRDFTPRTNA